MLSSPPRNQFLFKDEKTQTEVWVKRLDECHHSRVGNKWFKLKYNLDKAEELGFSTLLTFGGAFSNHIAATALLGKENGFRTIGVIRGEELGLNVKKTLSENQTLRTAHEHGMQFVFISREEYKQKSLGKVQEVLTSHHDKIYVLPEGGTNALAVKGCEEILTPDDRDFNLICCAVGTGGTISGIINSSCPHQKIWGFSALKADLSESIKAYTQKENWEIFEEDRFGGFARINEELVNFINRFAEKHTLPLDPLYTGKMMFALKEKIRNREVAAGSRVLVIHSGGLQGIGGMNDRLKKRNLPLLRPF